MYNEITAEWIPAHIDKNGVERWDRGGFDIENFKKMLWKNMHEWEIIQNCQIYFFYSLILITVLIFLDKIQQ